jgi:hypothetical protein
MNFKRKLAVLTFGLLFLISGCSEKHYFEPEEIKGHIQYDGELPAEIVEVGFAGATLKNGQVITESGLEEYYLPKDYRYINSYKDLVVAVGDCKPNIIYNKESGKIIELKLKRRIVAAMFIPDSTRLVFVLEGNSYGIYDYSEQKVVAKYRSDKAITADMRIANPIMLADLIIVPTLDGKLIIMQKGSGKRVREIIVGKGENFNNAIFLKIVGSRLIAATPHRIISVSSKVMDAQNIEIRDIVLVDKAIFILSADGTIYKCDESLKILDKKKFPFAHYVGAIYGKLLYIVEKEGYIISLDSNLTKVDVYRIADEIDDWFYSTKDTFYYEKYFFKLHQQ